MIGPAFGLHTMTDRERELARKVLNVGAKLEARYHGRATGEAYEAALDAVRALLREDLEDLADTFFERAGNWYSKGLDREARLLRALARELQGRAAGKRVRQPEKGNPTMSDVDRHIQDEALRNLMAERDRLRAENERLRAELMIAERGHRFDGSNECQNCHAPRNSRQGKGKCPFARLWG